MEEEFDFKDILDPTPSQTSLPKPKKPTPTTVVNLNLQLDEYKNPGSTQRYYTNQALKQERFNKSRQRDYTELKVLKDRNLIRKNLVNMGTQPPQYDFSDILD